MGKLEPHDPLDAVRKDPKGVVSFVLNPAHLRNQGLDCPPVKAFPPALLACTNLKRLELFRGIAHDGDPTIPDRIDRLKNLEELSLGGLALETLPDSIGRLSKLRILSLVYCESFSRLPDTIGDLLELEELSLGYTALEALPRTIGRLKKLKTLSLDGITAVPPELSRCESLATLHLPESVEQLPPGLGKLVHLETLTLSARALASIADELPKLAMLRSLRVSGTTKRLPSTVGALTNLEELNIGDLELEELPPLDELTKLKDLGVAGNKLTTLADVVATLPKLEALSFSGNPLARGEKKRIDALMKLPPKKRAKAGLDASAVKAASRTKRKPKPRRLGTVAGVNASLNMLVADARIAARFQGIGNGEDDCAANSDWDRLTEALSSKECARFDLEGGRALALTLGMGQGLVTVFRVDERLVLFEGFFEDDEESLDQEDREIFEEYIAGPPPGRAKKVGEFDIESGVLVLMPSTDACPDVEPFGMKRPKAPATECGAQECGLAIVVASSRYVVILEKSVESSWGSGRRCHLVPA